MTTTPSDRTEKIARIIDEDAFNPAKTKDWQSSWIIKRKSEAWHKATKIEAAILASVPDQGEAVALRAALSCLEIADPLIRGSALEDVYFSTLKKVRAALAAPLVQTPQVSGDYVLLPREPTDAMLLAGATRAKRDDSLMQKAPSYYGEARNIYKAMIAAASQGDSGTKSGAK